MELAKARETITAAVFFGNMIIFLLSFSVHVVSCDTFYTDSSLTLLQLLKKFMLCHPLVRFPKSLPTVRTSVRNVSAFPSIAFFNPREKDSP